MNSSEILGSVGVTILLVAYFLNMLKWLPTDGIVYPILNFTGAAIACYSSYLIPFFPFVILEGSWALLSGIAIGKWIRRKT